MVSLMAHFCGRRHHKAYPPLSVQIEAVAYIHLSTLTKHVGLRPEVIVLTSLWRLYRWHAFIMFTARNTKKTLKEQKKIVG